MRLKDLVTSGDHEIIDDGTPFFEVARRLGREGIHALYICDNGRPTGVVTHIDLVYAVAAERELSQLRAHDIATHSLITAHIEDSLERIKLLFEETRFVILPVLDAHSEILIGVVSKHDFFEHLVLPR